MQTYETQFMYEEIPTCEEELITCELPEPENQYLAIVKANWERLPWWLKARIFLTVMFYVWRRRFMQFIGLQV